MNTQKTKNDTVPIIGYRRPRNDKRKLKKERTVPTGTGSGEVKKERNKEREEKMLVQLGQVSLYRCQSNQWFINRRANDEGS